MRIRIRALFFCWPVSVSERRVQVELSAVCYFELNKKGFQIKEAFIPEKRLELAHIGEALKNEPKGSF